MTERRGAPRADHEPDPDGVEEHLRAAAERVPTTATDVGLRRVEQIARSRRRRQRMVVPSVAAVLVAAGITGVVIVSSSSMTDTVMTPVAPPLVEDPTEGVTTDVDSDDGGDAEVPTTAPSTTAGTVPTSTPSPSSPSSGERADPTPVEPGRLMFPPLVIDTFEVEPVVVEAPPVASELDANGALLPFGDGFLLTQSTMVGTPGFDLTVQDAQTMLGLELWMLIEASGATTPEEALAAAADAGRLDDVNAALAEEPQVLDALLNHRWTPALDLYTTLDGTAWEHTVLALPVERGLVRDVATDGQRLVVAVIDDTPDDEGFRDMHVSILITSDLATWSTHEWTVPDPARDVGGPVISTGQGQLVASEIGWAFALSSGGWIDAMRAVEDLVGEDLAAGSARTDADGVQVDIERRDGSIEEFDLTWEELGFDASAVVALLAGGELSIWEAAWEGEPVRRDVPERGGTVQLAETPTGYVTSDGSTLAFIELFGAETVTAPPVDGWIGGVFTVDDGALVAVRHERRPVAWYLVDPARRTWTPVEFDRVPAGSEAGPQPGSGWPTALGVTEYVEVVASTATWEQGDHVYTRVVDGPVETYEVRTQSGDLLVSEAIDRSDAQFEERFEFRRDGLAGTKITDPSSGEVLIALTPEETQQMAASATQLDGSPLPSYDVTPTSWLLAALDDGRWFLRELDGGLPPLSDIGAVNGDRMLVVRGDTWERYDL